MIATFKERVESEANQVDKTVELLPQPRTLSATEVAAVAGGPQTQNDSTI